MSGLLVKSALLVVMTHGTRALGRLAGPRRGALMLGLPSTTAAVLVDCGQQHGIDSAASMAEASLLGLVGAVVLPLIYARTLALGWRLPWTAAAAVGGYLLVAWGFSLAPGPGAVGCLGLAGLAVLGACGFAERIPLSDGERPLIAPSPLRCLVLRTVVPVACLAMVTTLREQVGTHWAGLLSTFPGMTLTVLVVTQLEAGAAEAGRIAKALPRGNLGMIAFLAAFRFGCPPLGLIPGTACGYLAAAATLLAVETVARSATLASAKRSTRRLERSPAWDRPIPTLRSRLGLARSPFQGPSTPRPRRPRPRPALRLRVEPIGL